MRARPRHLLILMVGGVMALLLLYYCSHAGARHWFADELPPPQGLANWTEAETDALLHKLSRWDAFNSSQYLQFVEHQIRGLHIERDSSFYFLEIGVGVGAFARHILRLFPHSSGHGVDVEPKAVAIADYVLSPYTKRKNSSRITLSVADMLDTRLDSGIFDYVFVPGAICYLHSMRDVLSALSEISRLLKPGAGVCLSMIASETSPTGSCVTRIPKYTFTPPNQLGMRMVSMEEMDDWGLPHAMGRYATCLRKI